MIPDNAKEEVKLNETVTLGVSDLTECVRRVIFYGLQEYPLMLKLNNYFDPTLIDVVVENQALMIKFLTITNHSLQGLSEWKKDSLRHYAISFLDYIFGDSRFSVDEYPCVPYREAQYPMIASYMSANGTFPYGQNFAQRNVQGFDHYTFANYYVIDGVKFLQNYLKPGKGGKSITVKKLTRRRFHDYIVNRGNGSDDRFVIICN